MMTLKKKFSNRRFKAGSYSTFAAVIVIAMAVLVNMVFGALPSSTTQLDVTSDSIYTLSDQTKRIAASLSEPVTLSLLAVTGNEDSTLVKLLTRYAELSDNLTYQNVDPNVDPTFLKGYDLSTSNLYANSVLVACGDKFRLVGYDELYVTDYSMNYSTYSYDTTTSFNGEQELTSAIHYVSGGDLPKVYRLTGHGESELSSTLTTSLEKENLDLEELSLLTAESVPEDASVVLINAPTSDLNETEASLLTAFIDNGGGVVLLTDSITADKMPNLLTLTGHMGLTVQDGMIFEGDSNHCLRGYNWYLVPTINSADITDPLVSGGYYALMPMAQAIVQTGSGNGTVTSLLTTSDSAYNKASVTSNTSTEKEDGDTDGPFDLAAAVEFGEGHFVWFGAAQMLDENVDNMVSGGNSDLFINSLNWMCSQEESISIRAHSLDTTTLTVPSSQASFWRIVMIFLIPGALLACGVIIWYRRKRK